MEKTYVECVSESAQEVVDMERKTREGERLEQELQEKQVAECYQIIGRLEAFALVRKVVTVSSLMQIKEIKESRAYKQLPGVSNWGNFCEKIGYSTRHIDEQLDNLEVLGDEFLETVSSFKIGFREIRRIKKLARDGAIQVSDSEVIIGDDHIPLSPDHKEDLEEALERLVMAKDEIIKEKSATIRANEKIIQSKQELIIRQEKDLARYEKEVEVKGPTAEEDAFIQNCRNSRVTIEGFLNQFDPQYNPLPEAATPKMKTELMLTLQSFLRSIKASHDTAAELYGDPDLDNQGWVPPHMRTNYQPGNDG